MDTSLGSYVGGSTNRVRPPDSISHHGHLYRSEYIFIEDGIEVTVIPKCMRADDYALVEQSWMQYGSGTFDSRWTDFTWSAQRLHDSDILMFEDERRAAETNYRTGYFVNTMRVRNVDFVARDVGR